MRIVSWNMGCAGSKYRANHEHAWRYLLDTLRPDIALVQEAMLSSPTWVSDHGQVLVRRSYGTQDWGSGIFLRAGETCPKLVDLVGSYVAAAEIIAIHGLKLLVASVHVCPDKKQKQYLRELTDYLRPMSEGQRVIVAGDFNAARLYDEVHKGNVYRWFFDELARMGLHDCHWGLHQREVPSCWPTRGTSYQTDHAFVDVGSARDVRSCDIVQDVDRTLSDHAPLVLVLDTPDAA